MKENIKRKLDIIDELFPIERVNKSKDRIKSLYFGDDFQVPVCHYPYGTPYYDLPELFGNWDGWIDKQLDECIIHGYLGDDFIPTIFPGCNIGTLPSLFGASYKLVGSDVVIDSVVHSYDEIDSLSFGVKEGSLAKYWLDFEEYILNETEGRINVNVIDSQGPMDAAGKIYNYEKIFELAYDDPDLYDTYLKTVTDAFIFYWKQQEKILGERFVNTHLYGWNWCPKEIGASMSCDSVVMVSPRFYETFYKPYIEKISSEFGGVTLHSCGYFKKVVPNLCNTHGLVGINAGQMTCEELYKSNLDKKIVIIPLIFNDDIDKNLKCIKENNIRVFLNIGFNDSEELINTKKYDVIKTKISEVKEYLQN